MPRTLAGWPRDTVTDGDAPAARNLLLVDDEKALLLTLSYALKHQAPSLNIMTAEDGRSACRLVNTCMVDLVITDLHMPVMDGFALIKYLSEHRPGTPVLAMTGAPLRDVEPRLASLGVSVCLEKSGDFQGLLDSIMVAARVGALPVAAA